MSGINAAGERVRVNEEYFDYGPDGVGWGPTRYHTVAIEKDGKVLRTYERQLCGGNDLAYTPGWIFSCVKGGTSPLAGAVYRFTKELPDCGGYRFVCKEGCRAGAPREMIQEPYECEEP
jgi:hypothetical protein